MTWLWVNLTVYSLLVEKYNYLGRGRWFMHLKQIVDFREESDAQCKKTL